MLTTENGYLNGLLTDRIPTEPGLAVGLDASSSVVPTGSSGTRPLGVSLGASSMIAQPGQICRMRLAPGHVATAGADIAAAEAGVVFVPPVGPGEFGLLANTSDAPSVRAIALTAGDGSDPAARLVTGFLRTVSGAGGGAAPFTPDFGPLGFVPNNFSSRRIDVAPGATVTLSDPAGGNALLGTGAECSTSVPTDFDVDILIDGNVMVHAEALASTSIQPTSLIVKSTRTVTLRNNGTDTISIRSIITKSVYPPETPVEDFLSAAMAVVTDVTPVTPAGRARIVLSGIYFNGDTVAHDFTLANTDTPPEASSPINVLAGESSNLVNSAANFAFPSTQMQVTVGTAIATSAPSCYFAIVNVPQLDTPGS